MTAEMPSVGVGNELDLSPEEKEYIMYYWQKMRKCNHKANVAARKWLEAKDRLKAYCAANNYDETSTRKRMSEDWAMKDEMDSWSWNAREAARCAEIIQAEYTARRLMAGIF